MSQAPWEASARSQLTALLPPHADPECVDDIINCGSQAILGMYLTNLAEAKKNGFFIASTQMSYDENDKYFCLYSVGFTSLGLPEIVLKNVHKSFKATATSVFFRVYQILTAGTPFLPGHGVSSNGVKYIVAQPSKSELRQLQDEFLGQACTLFGEVQCYELLVSNALFGFSHEQLPPTIPNAVGENLLISML